MTPDESADVPAVDTAADELEAEPSQRERVEAFVADRQARRTAVRPGTEGIEAFREHLRKRRADG